MTLSTDPAARHDYGVLADPDGLAAGQSLTGHEAWFVPARLWLGQGFAVPRSGQPNDNTRARGRRALALLQEPCLLWSPWAEDGSAPLPGKAGGLQPAMLTRFAALGDRDDEAIARYARSYGVLGLCAHRLPRTHSDACGYVGGPDGWEEPLATWREWSRRARAILSLSAAHRTGRLGEVTDCRDLLGGQMEELVDLGDSDGPPSVSRSVWWREEEGEFDRLTVERMQVLEALDNWLKVGQVRLGVSWTGSDYGVATRGAGLFGALGLQLLLVVMRSPGLSFCKGCTFPFEPSPEHRTYCEDCGEDQRARARERKRRQRARAAGATPAS